MAIAALINPKDSKPADSTTGGQRIAAPKDDLLKDGQLKDERNRFLAFAFAAADLLIEVDARLCIRFAVGAADGLAGRGAAALTGSDFRALFSEGDRAVIAAAVKRLGGHSRMEPIALRMQRPDGKSTGIALSGCRMPFMNGAIHFAISALRPALAEATIGDDNLLDGGAFEKSVLACLKQPETMGSDAALSLYELDGVDTLRKRGGDRATDALFAQIGGCLRAYAIGGLAGRLGPNKLAAVTDGNAAADVSKEIAAILKLHDPEGAELHVKELAIALDVADLSPADAAKALAYSLQEFAAGDIANLPVGSLVDGFRAMMAATAKRVIAFKNSLTDRGMRLAFQPVVEMTPRRIHHYEVLTRFADGKSPFETIEFAERVGLIEELDLLVAERALNYLDNAGPGNTAQLAVNISGRSIQNDLFIGELDKLLKRHDIVRRRVLFEITESTTIGDLARTNQVIQSFREAGNAVCLDDFGAGAASLPYLRAFHVDYIKIDGAYVRRMQDSDRDLQIMNAMIGMCRQVKTAIVAEMIETQKQAQSLLALGVEFGQGYYFGKPADKLATLATLRPGSKI
ncbi:MAG TPA: EAL domain-containing protein [Stellaceae bacterium]|jgi:EAL domain-containing protein (putative c-di-GMP-specific phosphodiesterase class I)|nr:EAL domain-containing protein [Stellaceae bacterium]